MFVLSNDLMKKVVEAVKTSREQDGLGIGRTEMAKGVKEGDKRLHILKNIIRILMSFPKYDLPHWH